MAERDGEKTLAQSNIELETAIVEAAVAMFWLSCPQDNIIKAKARELGEGLVGIEKFKRALEAKRPRLKQLDEIIARMQS